MIMYPNTPITNKFFNGIFYDELFDWCTYFFIFAIVLKSSIKNMINQIMQSPTITWESLKLKIIKFGIPGNIAQTTNKI